MTIEARAKEYHNDMKDKHPFPNRTVTLEACLCLARKGYIIGAQDQKKIDIEKACEWFRDENSHAVSQWLDQECEKLRKAMEE